MRHEVSGAYFCRLWVAMTPTTDRNRVCVKRLDLPSLHHPRHYGLGTTYSVVDVLICAPFGPGPNISSVMLPPAAGTVNVT